MQRESNIIAKCKLVAMPYFVVERTSMPEDQIIEVALVELGNIPQRIAISGNIENSIILILHGGGLPLPGVASKNSYRLLSEHFLVVFWDQRGSGLSTHRTLDNGGMGIEDFLSDVVKLTAYLKTRFDREKIYLAGHSWGSMLGLHSVVRHPENYYGYVGIAQQINPQLSDKVAYDDLQRIAAEGRDQSMLRKLDSLGQPPYKGVKDWLRLRELVARNHGLVSGKGEVGLIGLLIRMFGSFLGNRDYSWFEVFRFQKKMNSVLSKIYKDLLAYNMTEVTRLEIPIVLMHGVYDLNSHPEIAKNWFDRLSAPSKAWIEFDQSAHMPMCSP